MPMHVLPITSITAALMAIIFLVLAARVGQVRGRVGASLGDGSGGVIAAGQEHTAPLLVASRSHANFCEYVPLALVMMALVELRGAPHWLMLALATMLVAGRVLHPIGMGRAIPNPFRAGGAMLSFLVILGEAVELLVQAFR